MTAQKRTRPRKSNVYDPEILYPFWEAAGSNVQEAMRLAEAAAESRVPSRHDTWHDYAAKFAFVERMRKAQQEKWAKFHKEREDKEQFVLDSVAHLFETVMDRYSKELMLDFELLLSEDMELRSAARKRLDKMLSSPESFDRFYRMYLRARGQPEKITKMEHDGTIATTYGDLDEKPKGKTPEEAKRIAEGKQG